MTFFLQMTFLKTRFGKYCVCSKWYFLKTSSCWLVTFSESARIIITGQLDSVFLAASFLLYLMQNNCRDRKMMSER